jgi:O-antigen/teichoic acid export membrane protein
LGSLILVPRYGVMGLAIAVTAAQAVGLVATALVSRHIALRVIPRSRLIAPYSVLTNAQ